MFDFLCSCGGFNVNSICKNIYLYYIILSDIIKFWSFINSLVLCGDSHLLYPEQAYIKFDTKFVIPRRTRRLSVRLHVSIYAKLSLSF